MPFAVEQYKVGRARVIPIIVRPIDCHQSPFGGLKALPKDGKPIVAKEIRKVLAELVQTSPVKENEGSDLFGSDKPRPQAITSEMARAIANDYRPAKPGSDVRWRFAYAFLRLDQLPSGGWAKSLPSWLQALLDGPDDVVITAETRTKGGTDLTSCAFVTYLRFLCRLNCDKPTPGEPASKGEIAWSVRKNISDKIGWDGGVGVGKPSKAAHHIRHTLMGFLTLLYVSECTGGFPEKDISRMENYLRDNLPRWRSDKSHPFACFCILAKLREKLAEMDLAGQRNAEVLSQEMDRCYPKWRDFCARGKSSNCFRITPAVNQRPPLASSHIKGSGGWNVPIF
jgi:hypothetical protein